ncbi:Na+/H+ antiporter subunit E [Noviherbaspirillum aerium]|uniref:Na+/H+ antiporter subunit E n=1 Tax=Noviherbaspirillum aerium TaxID=2588497 RepID=UPI00124F2128|nr:Na+/H+ antiporter subunit E [Noviherbaspirillum aerium]
MTGARWFPHPLVSLSLLAIWLILNSSIAPGQVLLGALLAWAIPWSARAVWSRHVVVRHPATVLRLLATVLYDIVVANLNVARLVLGPVSKLRPAFIRFPLELDEPYAIWTLASIITLTPGTVSSDISEDRRTLLVHVLDTDDADALIAEIKHRYETPLKEIFEC